MNQATYYFYPYSLYSFLVTARPLLVSKKELFFPFGEQGKWIMFRILLSSSFDDVLTVSVLARHFARGGKKRRRTRYYLLGYYSWWKSKKCSFNLVPPSQATYILHANELPVILFFQPHSLRTSSIPSDAWQSRSIVGRKAWPKNFRMLIEGRSPSPMSKRSNPSRKDRELWATMHGVKGLRICSSGFDMDALKSGWRLSRELSAVFFFDNSDWRQVRTASVLPGQDQAMTRGSLVLV